MSSNTPETSANEAMTNVATTLSATSLSGDTSAGQNTAKLQTSQEDVGMHQVGTPVIFGSAPSVVNGTPNEASRQVMANILGVSSVATGGTEDASSSTLPASSAAAVKKKRPKKRWDQTTLPDHRHFTRYSDNKQFGECIRSLPPEVRAMIWEYLLSNFEEKNRLPNQLKAFRGDRQLYKEVAQAHHRTNTVVVWALNNGYPNVEALWKKIWNLRIDLTYLRIDPNGGDGRENFIFTHADDPLLEEPYAPCSKYGIKCLEQAPNLRSLHIDLSECETMLRGEYVMLLPIALRDLRRLRTFIVDLPPTNENTENFVELVNVLLKMNVGKLFTVSTEPNKETWFWERKHLPTPPWTGCPESKGLRTQRIKLVHGIMP